METTCIRCGAALSCNPGPDCWCARVSFRPMPRRLPAGAPEGCLCPACLGEVPPAAERGDAR